MIKKIDANKYGVVRYAISSIEDIADLPREVSVGSEAILVNEDGEKKFRLGSDGWVEVVEVKEYDEDKLRDILEDAKVGYGGIEYETLEERLDRDFDNVYSVLDNRTYVEYEGCRITAKDSLNGLQKDTVIKGRTLQNLCGEVKFVSSLYVENDDSYSLTLDVGNGQPEIQYILPTGLKTNTVYTLIIDIKEYNCGYIHVLFHSFSQNSVCSNQVSINTKGVSKIKLTTTNDVTNAFLRMFNRNGISNDFSIGKNIIVLEGDYTQTLLEELPYVEGIESVGDKNKNLINLRTLQKSDNSNEFEFLDNGEVLFKGIGVISRSQPFVEVKVKPNTNMIFTAKTKENNNFYAQVFSLNEGARTSIVANYELKNTGLLKFNTGNAETIAVHLGKHLSTSNDITVYDVQLKEGTEVTTYEPYYDGYRISGKSRGKNMVKNNNYKCTFLTTKYQYTSQDPLSIIERDIKVKPNTNYILTYSKLDSTMNIKIITSEYPIDAKDHTDAYSKGIREIGIHSGSMFTTLENENYITLTTGNWNTSDKNNFEIVNLQIEESATPTTYEPYKESTYSYILDEPLRSLPNGVCDTIDLETGVLTRRVGKVMFDGTETWRKASNHSNENFSDFRFALNGVINKNHDCGICDRFIYATTASDWIGTREAVKLYTHADVTEAIFSIPVSKNNDLEAFKQWLQANPTTIYYELANPITEYLIKDDKFVTLPNGVKDEISHNSVLRKVGKVVIDGSIEMDSYMMLKDDTIGFTTIPHIRFKKVKLDEIPNIVNNIRFTVSSHNILANMDAECISLTSNKYEGYSILVRVSKSRLTSPDTNGIREWLTLNPITVWYELEEPYTEPINLNEVILNTTRLKSYEPITHITSDNYLPPTIKTQVPSDFNAVVLGLKNNNEALASQVMSLRQTNDELEVTNREQDDVIDVTLLALDEVYGMIDEGEIETMSVGSPMVNVYVKMIKRGIKTLDEVPAKYRAEVEELI